MNHPELIAVPVLMLADYALTILGAKASAGVYRDHFKESTYELNPLWRKTVDQMRWFNPRRLALVALLTVWLLVLDRVGAQPFELLLGLCFGVYGALCGCHLTNLLTFYYLTRHPDEISGQVQLSARLILKLSQFGVIGLIPLFIIVVALAPNQYTFGVLIGIVGLVLVHFVWARKAKRTEESLNKQEEKGP